jgi:hypothetical protein
MSTVGNEMKSAYRDLNTTNVMSCLTITSAIFISEKRFWNAKSDPKFGRRVVVLVIPMPGKRGPGTASRDVPSQNTPTHNLIAMIWRQRLNRSPATVYLTL